MNLNEFVLNPEKNKRKVTRPLTNNIQIGTAFQKESTPSTKINWGHSEISLGKSSSKSPRNSTKTSNSDGNIIMAITEGRGSAQCEIGLSVMDVYKPNLVLCQLSDVQSYVNIITKINYYDPDEILVPSTFDKTPNNRLIDQLKANFPNMKITGISRSVFSKTTGLDFIKKLCIPELDSIILVLQYKYYALAATSALFTYIQDGLSVYYNQGTIKVNYEESEGHTIIDISTVDNLELVSSSRPAQTLKYSSLYSVLNRCFTKIGARTLRSAILQPLFNISYINERLDCVERLNNNKNMLYSVQAILQKVPNIDQLLTIGTLMPEQAQNCSNKHINYVLLLNEVLEIVGPLGDILEDCEENFFIHLTTTLKSQSFNEIKTLIANEINENAKQAKGQNAILQRCFAIKSGVSGILDVARKNYTERFEDLKVYVKMLADKYGLPLTLNNNNAKGYHIVMPLNQQQKRFMKNSDLPAEFIEVSRTASSFTMKTIELSNMAIRLNEIMTQVLRLSNIVLYGTITKLKKYVCLFYTLVENVAHLDMLQSLTAATLGPNYVRPKFSDYTEVKDSSHPLLEFILPSKPNPNLIQCCKYYNFHIITGPNGSGKSVYIRQVFLLQLMAQIGCFVPAKEATFRPADRMFSRIYLEDRMECGASAFVLEMREIKYILSTMTDNSLIVIDELCRSTSLEEGTALAMAISEKLLQTGAFIYLTTHYTLITKLADMYCNIKVWQLKTDDNREEKGKLDYKYSVIPGVTQIQRYGLYLIENLWAEDLVRNIYEIWKDLQKDSPICPINNLKEDHSFRNTYEELAKFHKETDATSINDNSSNILTINSEFLEPQIDIIDSSQNSNNYQIFSQPLIDNRATSTPIQIPNQENNIPINSNNVRIEPIQEDFMNSSKREDEFTSSSHYDHYVSPVVNIIEGPNDKTLSFDHSEENSVEKSRSLLNMHVEMTLDESSNKSKSTSDDINWGKSTDKSEITSDRLSKISIERKLSQSSGSKEEKSSKVSSTSKNLSKSTTRKKYGKFIPPRKLTRREIEEDFREQDKKFLQGSMDRNSTNYLNFMHQIMNRPTVKQLQNCQHLVKACRTSNGNIEVLEYDKPKTKKKILKQFSKEQFDVTIFSDRNSATFQEYLQSDEKDYKKFKFDFSNSRQLQQSNFYQNESLATLFENAMKRNQIMEFSAKNNNGMGNSSKKRGKNDSVNIFGDDFPSETDLDI